jgi:hypothetical protein
MDERILGGALIALFAWFLYIASSDIVHLLEQRLFGGVSLLLFCVIACVGWLAFLGALTFAPRDAASSRRHTEWHPASE